MNDTLQPRTIFIRVTLLRLRSVQMISQHCFHAKNPILHLDVYRRREQLYRAPKPRSCGQNLHLFHHAHCSPPSFKLIVSGAVSRAEHGEQTFAPRARLPGIKVVHMRRCVKRWPSGNEIPRLAIDGVSGTWEGIARSRYMQLIWVLLWLQG